jgi:ADP-ribose pyrophosphatase YjhB (NUDIX family)
MKYCSRCGARTSVKVPAGDNRQRFVCDACDTVHYRNPRVITGLVAEWQGRVLLCRRGIEPRYGLWTVPAGFLELGESVQEGAVRETLEETRARVEVDALFTTFSLTHIGQVYMLFRGRVLSPEFGPTEESLETALFDAASTPWDELAFPVVRETLKRYFQDREAGGFGVYTGEIVRDSPDFNRYRLTMLPG